MKSKKAIIFISVLVLVFASGYYVASSENPEKNEDPIIRERDPDKDNNSSIGIDENLILSRNRGVEIPEIEAEAAYSVYFSDGEKQVLFSRNRNKRLPVASITKLMTALVVYENYDLDESIGIPDSEFFTNEHLNDLRVFTDTTYGEVLYPLLLESNNSGAYAAATAPDDLDFDDFISLMNEKADYLGMNRTVYHNPSGLDTVRGVNLSTARDTAKLIEELLEIPEFWKIMQKPNYRISSHRSDLYYQVDTTNKFLDGTYFSEKPDWYEDIIGGKTGFTYRAMGCLVMVLETDDGYVVNIILGADGRNERFEEMEALIDWVYQAYEI